jgi:hypothetical protein
MVNQTAVNLLEGASRFAQKTACQLNEEAEQNFTDVQKAPVMVRML